MASDTPLSPVRAFVTAALGFGTLLCAILFYLSFGIVMLQSIGGVYDGAGLFFIGLILTLPPAVICTIIALVIAGPKRCRLAWISLCSYPLLFILMIIVSVFLPHNDAKPPNKALHPTPFGRG